LSARVNATIFQLTNEVCSTIGRLEKGSPTMAYVARPTDFRTGVSLHRGPEKTTARPGFLRRLFDTIMDSRQLRANRDVEAFLARRGYRLTDSIERDLNEHLFNGGWNSRR
jgi:hypothetical protein